MNLVKLPSRRNDGSYVYVNPDNVTYLYELDDNTHIVTNDTEINDPGLCIPLSIDEVAERLTNGNRIYDVMNTLRKNSEGGDSK